MIGAAGIMIGVLALQTPSPVPLIHLAPAQKVELQQTGTCQGRAYKLTLVQSDGWRVATFSVDGVAWSADELAKWNRELAVVNGDPVASFECVAKGDAVRIEGWTNALGDETNYVAVTASGGKGRWFGFEQARFKRTVTPTGVETRRAP